MELKKIISFNVNGLRACAKKGLFDFLEKEKPQVLAIQEIKATHNQIEEDHFHPAGYEVVLFPAEKPGYSGVGLYIKKGFKYEIEKGLGVKEFDKEGRCMTIHMDGFSFITAYFPNSQAERNRLKYKLEFCSAMKEYLDKLNKQRISEYQTDSKYITEEMFLFGMVIFDGENNDEFVEELNKIQGFTIDNDELVQKVLDSEEWENYQEVFYIIKYSIKSDSDTLE